MAEVLGCSNPRKALKDHVDSEDKGVTKCYTLGGEQELTVINESGLYSLILSSKLPTAKKFKRWVTAEVLPSIRKNGMYATDATIDKFIEDPEYAIRILTAYKEERDKARAFEAKVEEQKETIAVMEPKAKYYDIILQCPDLVTTTVIAKDYGLSARKLNSCMSFTSSTKWMMSGFCTRNTVAKVSPERELIFIRWVTACQVLLPILCGHRLGGSSFMTC